MATIALILGLLGVAVGIIPLFGFYGAHPGILAVVLGLVSRGRAARAGGAGRGRATAAIWLGALAVVLIVAGSISVPGSSV